MSNPTEMRLQTAANLVASYDAIEALMSSLSDSDWNQQSLCPAWTTRGVITHLAGVEHCLSGWKPTDADSFPPFDQVAAFESEVESLDAAEFSARVSAVFSDRRDNLETFTDEDFALEQMTPVGPGTYQRFMDIRVFDFWVHERDITTPLGRETDDTGPAAERSLNEVEMSLGYIVGKKVGLPDGMSIAIDLTGPITNTMFVSVEGRAKAVDHIAEPSVTLTTDSTTFVQLACGRLDPQGPIDSGKITWSGDAEWGEKAARSLAFTM